MTATSINHECLGQGVNADGSSDVFMNLADAVRGRFENVMGLYGPQVFTTNVDGLFQTYLDGYANDIDRAHHQCTTCRQFIERFGHLVVINADGMTIPLFWGEPGAGLEIPAMYQQPIANMARAVAAAKVNGVFLSEEKRWGIPKTGNWNHFAVHPNPAIIHRDKLLTPGQKMAEKREDFRILSQSLAEYSADTVNTAMTLLSGDALFRAEKVIGVARWFQGLQATLGQTRGKIRENLIWAAVAVSGPGLTHVRSSMVGTLLDDISEGKDFDEVKAAFKYKMDPSRYGRPIVAPGAGNIKKAEEIVAKLGVASAFKRRFATLGEIQEKLWETKQVLGGTAEAQLSSGGVFGHLKTTTAPAQTKVPVTAITWEKFRRTVLGNAAKIEFFAEANKRHLFFALTSQSDPAAQPIIQWDFDDARNPVSWYVYPNGKRASDWGLVEGVWYPVSLVMERPSMWNGNRCPHMGDGVMLVVPGAMDKTGGECLHLFPEILRQELRQVRATVEAHSNAGRLEGDAATSVSGISIPNNSTLLAARPVRVRATVGNVVTEYSIDRWD